MPTPFADLELRVNSACIEHLANAVASWTPAGGGGAVEADVIAPLPYHGVDDGGLLQHVQTIRVGQDTWPDAAADDAVQLRGDEYVIRTVEREAAGGLKRIALAKVA